MNNRWPLPIVLLHWVTALVIAGMFISGLWMVDLNYYSQWYKTAPHWHKSVGLLLLAATLFRIVLRVLSQRPAAHGKAFEKLISTIGHFVLYVLMLGLFISGYLISAADGKAIDIFNWVSIPAVGSVIENQEDKAGTIHFYLAWTLISLVTVHLLAAFKHHFVSKDDTLKQMLRLR